MGNLIRGEFYKLRKSKYFIGMIIIAIIVGFYLIFLWDNDAQKLQVSHPDLVNGIHSIYYSFQFITVSSFVFALFAGEFISKDFKNSTISKCFSYGYSRSKVILSKLIVFILFTLFLELIYTTILVVYTSMNYGFCEILDSTTILYLTRLIVIGLMYNLATICIIAMIAIITKSNFFTIISPVILMSCFLLASSKLGPYIAQFFSYMPNVSGLIAIKLYLSKTDIIKGIISSIVTFIITFGVSILYVKHEDIK